MNLRTEDLSSTSTPTYLNDHDNASLIAATTVPPLSIDPLTPCPREVFELVIGLIFGALIVLSNLASVRVTAKQKSSSHPQSKYFIINLAVSNLFCGVALLGTNAFELAGHVQANGLTPTICYEICRYWAPVYVLFVMVPYVALAGLGVDIAIYCHRPMDYHRRMSRVMIWFSVALCWLYPISVILVGMLANRNILCDMKHWELNIYIIIFPIFLMLLPAVVVIVIFSHILHRHWSESRHLARRMSLARIGAAADTRGRMVRRFLMKFSHLIVFSIVCGLLFTFLTVIEVVLEFQTHQRICVLYRLDRLFISLNSLLAPWIHSLATHSNRKKFKRKLLAWWHNHGSPRNEFSLRKRQRSDKTGPLDSDGSCPRSPALMTDGDLSPRILLSDLGDHATRL